MGRFTKEKKAEVEAEKRKKDSSQGTESSETGSGALDSPASGTPVAELKAQYQEAREEKKERKPRKKKAIDVDTEKRDQFLSGFVLFSSLALKMICARLPNPLPPTPEETEMFNTTVTGVMTKYFASIANWDAELSLLVACVFIFIPRMKSPQEEVDAETGRDDLGKDGNGQDGIGKVAD
jgi:hypothetical protein